MWLNLELNGDHSGAGTARELLYARWPQLASD